MMTLLAVGGLAVWAALLVLSQFGTRRAAPSIRPALRWIFTSALLICTSAVIGAATLTRDWQHINPAVSAAEVVIALAGLICLMVGIVKMPRRSFPS